MCMECIPKAQNMCKWKSDLEFWSDFWNKIESAMVRFCWRRLWYRKQSLEFDTSCARKRHCLCVSVCVCSCVEKRKSVLLCFIDPRVRKIRNEASSCPGIFSRTLRFHYVASSPGSPLPHLLDGHRKLVGCSAIPARSCPGPVRYHWGSIVEL